MGNNRNPRIEFKCENCGNVASDRPSHYKRKKRHFCSQGCYSDFRRDRLPIEEHSRYGKGHSAEEKKKRVKARSILNHHLRDNHIERLPCEICGNQAEAHHNDYDKPLDVRWLCFKHHRLYHKIGMKVYENPELLNP